MILASIKWLPKGSFLKYFETMYKEKIEQNIRLLNEAVFNVMKNHTERYDAMVYIFQAVARGMGYNKELMKNHFSKNKMYEYMREVYNYLYLKLMVEEEDNNADTEPVS